MRKLKPNLDIDVKLFFILLLILLPIASMPVWLPPLVSWIKGV